MHTMLLYTMELVSIEQINEMYLLHLFAEPDECIPGMSTCKL